MAQYRAVDANMKEVRFILRRQRPVARLFHARSFHLPPITFHRFAGTAMPFLRKFDEFGFDEKRRMRCETF
jgi:hypothetical protein